MTPVLYKVGLLILASEREQFDIIIIAHVKSVQ